MGIFDRLATLLKSNINDLISKAENPEKMLDQIVTDMRNQLAKAKQQVAAIFDTTREVFAHAAAEGVPTAIAADRVAERRIREIGRLQAIHV